MPRQRSPNRERAFEIWQDSGRKIPLKGIAAELNVSASQVRNWKVQDKWDDVVSGGAGIVAQRNANDGATKPNRGAPKGNRNTVGNIGGLGGPIGNKKAVTTGEHETIWFDTLEPEERALYASVNTGTLVQIEQELRLLEIRERRMLQRIADAKNGMADPATTVVTGTDRQGPIDARTEQQESRYERILRLEDALTRVQEKKLKLLDLQHKIQSVSAPGNPDLSPYIQALNRAAEDVWNDDDSGDEA
ncbi:MAG: phage terminase small subunit [Bacilli bacterium]